MDTFFDIPTLTEDSARASFVEALNAARGGADLILEGLVRAAANALGCPVAAVTLLDGEQAHFRARVGIARARLPLKAAPCTVAVQGHGLCEVPDVLADPDFAARPLVTGGRQVRFYAGVPLEVGDVRVGTLCVMDSEPRTLSETQRQLLMDLAKSAQSSLEATLERKVLGEESSFYAAAFESLGDGVLIFDADAVCRSANGAAAEIFGVRRDALVGTTLTTLLPDAKSRSALYMAMADEDGKPFLSEYGIARPDGVAIHVEVNSRRIDSSRYVAVVRRIDERIEAELQLRQLSMAVEQSSDSVMVTDLSGRIEYVNEACVTTSGYSREEFIGHTPKMLQSGRTPENTYRALWETLNAGGTWRGPLVNRRKDGTEYVELAAISPIRSASGKVTHYISVKQNITEFQQMGEELERHRHHLEELVNQRTEEIDRARRAAEAANRAKTGFLATVSHEIRTPMNGVVGLIEVLRESPLDAHQKALTDTIRDSAFALLGVIDDILDFSKIESGRLTLEDVPFDPRAIVEGVCDGLLPQAWGNGIELQCFVDPGLPRRWSGDPLRLRQILNSIAGNAVKFSGGLGRPGRVRVSAHADGPATLRLTVEDNGIGMSPEVQARAFQPFEQAEAPTTRRYGGTGLGLAICRRLVDLFRGEIQVWSEPDRGTRITITLQMHPLPGTPRAKELDGVRCAILHRDPTFSRDLLDYVVAAGAQADELADADALGRLLDAHSGGPLVAVVERVDDLEVLDRLQRLHQDHDVSLLMLDRGRRRRPRLKRAGLVSLDIDALHHDAFLEAMLLACGRRAPDAGNAAGTSVAKMHGLGGRAAGTRILVAEDNELNQHVIHHQLALLGIGADIAFDGAEALERLRSGQYAMLVTDLHMPRMDGYELARRIREEPGELSRIPIVALTANALKDERDNCLAVGMNEHLTKPVQLELLAGVIARLLPDARADVRANVGAGDAGHAAADAPVDAALQAANAADAVDGLAVFDARALAQLVGDDPAVLAEFWRDFIASARKIAAQIDESAAAGDWKAVGSQGHKLKSSSRSVGAMALGARCEALEAAGKRGDAEGASSLLAGFHAALDAALGRISARLDETTSEPAATPASPVPVAASRECGPVVAIDDQPLDLQTLLRQLQSIGVEHAVACGSGAEALEWLHEHGADDALLLLDLDMPGMDGVEFIRRLAGRGFAGGIALVSGSDRRLLESAGRLATAYKLDMLGILHKPVAVESLNALLARWSERRAPNRDRVEP